MGNHQLGVSSAGSRDLLCKRLKQFTAKVITNPLFHLLNGQEPSGLDNGSLAVDSLWLNAVEPGTLGRQPARDDAYTTFAFTPWDSVQFRRPENLRY